MKELICICCPQGCRLRVDEEADYAVSGHRCQRGEDYGREEMQNPTRVLTSSVRVEGSHIARCPGRTNLNATSAGHTIFLINVSHVGRTRHIWSIEKL